MTALPTWDEQMEALKGVADHLLATWRPDAASEAEVQDMNKLALSILACGYLCNVYTDARRPVFMPLWNYACNQGGPNPRSTGPASMNWSAGGAPCASWRSLSRRRA